MKKERYMKAVGRAQRCLVCAVALLAVGCFTPDVGDTTTGTAGEKQNPLQPSSEMAPSYLGTDAELPDFAVGRMATRSLIDQDATVRLSANFLRVDEDVKSDPGNITEHHRGLYTFNDGDSRYEGAVNWEKAYLLEAALMSSPDNSPERLRSVFLEPEQSYRMRVVATDLGGGVVQKDTTDFYHTRMVSWHPMNCRVPRTPQGTAAAVLFGEGYYDQTGITTERDIDNDGEAETVMAIKFSNLDGKTDVMVSDVREGQHWHFNDGVHRSDFMPDDETMTGESIYAPPFGHFEQEGIEGVQREIKYRNYFTYKHYLSAIRIFAYAEQSQQNLTMWGEIEKVIVCDQPTSVKVWLPSEEGVWGESFDWDDHNHYTTTGTPIFGEGDTGGDMPETVEFPISLRGVDSAHKSYLGYALVQPDRDVTLQLHTTSGVYEITIPVLYEYTEGGVEKSAELFKEGYIYNIHLNLQTKGSIAALLEKEHEYVYYDLTRLITYENPNEEQLAPSQIELYKYANSYICSPLHTLYTDPDTGITRPYDGFCFSATVVGNGQAGILSQGVQSLYPTNANINPMSARLLWESELGLVDHVELLYGYVRFRTPHPDREGNAVIAVYDKQDNLLWSWHIWITDPPQDQTYENGAKDIVMLDRNLGATASEWINGTGEAAEEAALATYGLYYQWGRKDPSMGPPEAKYLPINLVTSPYYDYSSRERTAAEVVQFAHPTMEDAVSNPMFLILPTAQSASQYYYNWLDSRIDFLWGYDPQTGLMAKSIYDPCPFGYRVPLGEMTTIFTNAETSQDFTIPNNGYGLTIERNGETFWFPFAGFKGADKGLTSLVLGWKYVGEKGDYMSSSVNMSPGKDIYHRSRSYISRESSWEETKNLSYSSNVWLDHTNRRTAGSVRCIKSDVIGTLDLTVETSKQYMGPNDEVTIVCAARSAESFVTKVLITVENLETGEIKELYATSEGSTESERLSWSKTLIFHTGDEDGDFYSVDGYKFTFFCQNSVGASNLNSTIVRVGVGEPLEAAITSDTFVFDGDKSSGGISASVSTPNDCTLSEVKIIDNSGNVLYHNDNLTSSAWNATGIDINFHPGENRTFTLWAVDDVGMQIEVTTTTTTTVYGVEQITSVPTAGGTYIIENTNYLNTFLYDAGNNLAAGALSPDALFVIDSGYKFRSVATGHYASGGTSYNAGVSSDITTATSAPNHTIVDEGTTFRIYRGNNYYWRQTGRSSVAVTNWDGLGGVSWNIYRVTTN